MKKTLLYFILLFPFLVLSQIPSYYSDVNLNLTGQALKDELATKIITTHTTFLSYTPGVWDAIKQTDLDPNDNTKVLLIYGYNDTDGDPTTDRTRGVNMNGGNLGDWNREHVYAKSLGTPDLGTSGPGADAHHLRAADVQWNSIRSNRKFTAGSGNSGTVGTFWYPGDEWKGDVARMMMYMYLRYGSQCLPINVGEGNPVATDSNMIDLFLQWNVEDPVSAFEDQRNPVLENIQGNRNPFIDNPAFATQIWGGPQAEDRFGNAPSDTQSPTAPTGVVASNVTQSSVDLSWTASTDNVGVTGYDVYKSGVYLATVSTTNYQVTGLTASTSYTFVIYAKDAAGNISGASNTVNITTSAPSGDTQAPTSPMGVVASNVTESSVDLSWTASTDNVGVTGYDVYKSGAYLATVATTSYQATGLTASTSYSFVVYAKDADGNVSAASNTVNVTTGSGSGGGTVSELFISEYVEGTSNNKAIEIANFTGASVDLSIYSLKRNTNGGTTWGAAYSLVGIVANQDVFVVANSSATAAILNVSDATTGADALLFNGNDPVGLFKNDVLIDIVGPFNGGTANFAADTTLRRKSTVLSPSATYIASQWDVFPVDTFDGLGSHAISGGSGPDTQAPTAPTNLAASNITETSIDVSWTASTDNVGVTGYDVYVDGVLNMSTTNTFATITGLVVNTTYSLTVYAKDAAGNVSAASAAVNATTVDLTAPTTPTGVVASNVTSSSVDLSWTASTDNVGVIGYDVYESGAYLTTVTTTSYQATGLTASTSYSFVIYAKDTAGNVSVASNTVNVTTNASQPSGSVVLHEGFFETGWDGWTDGGVDCDRYSGSRSFEGSFSIQLRDNSGIDSAMTSPIFNLSSFDSVEISFYFYSFSMESREDFFVKYFDGSAWVNIADYVSGTDFNNDSFYTVTLTLDSALYNLASNAQFRIQCDASSNSDIIYIDQVIIKGINNAAAKTGITKSNTLAKSSINLIGYKDTSFEGLDNFMIYPNPVLGNTLNIKTDSDFANYKIFNVFGQSVKQGVLTNEMIEVESLKSGVYLIELSDGEDVVTKKFIKQ